MLPTKGNICLQDFKMEDADFAYALQLQQQFDAENESHEENDIHILSIGASATANVQNSSDEQRNRSNLEDECSEQMPLSLIDKAWELIDPSPDVRALFVEYNRKYFWGTLDGVEVRWSPRMTLCAGLCVYEGRGGLCSVRLSEPLLKLRPRSDLVETLLHEMIHAYLFVTDGDRDRDGHGPNFCQHMKRLNKLTGANISIYHTFHDEVDSYRQHWWRCDGSCRSRQPFFGYVKRAMNRAPSANDTWWTYHQSTCGGTFHKVQEPEGYGVKAGSKDKSGVSTLSAADKKKQGNGVFSKWLKTDDGGSSSTVSVSHTSDQKKNDNRDIVNNFSAFDDENETLSDIELIDAVDTIEGSFTRSCSTGNLNSSVDQITSEPLRNRLDKDNVSRQHNGSQISVQNNFLSKAMNSAGRILKDPPTTERLYVESETSSNNNTTIHKKMQLGNAKPKIVQPVSGTVLGDKHGSKRSASDSPHVQQLTGKDILTRTLSNRSVPVGSSVFVKDFVSVCNPVHCKKSCKDPLPWSSDQERSKRQAEAASEFDSNVYKRQRLGTDTDTRLTGDVYNVASNHSRLGVSPSGERNLDTIQNMASTSGWNIGNAIYSNSVMHVDNFPDVSIIEVPPDSGAAGNSKLVPCPVCQRLVAEMAVNEHLDMCLGSLIVCD